VRDLGLRNAKDRQIFFAAMQANAVVMTKDADRRSDRQHPFALQSFRAQAARLGAFT